jgi:hypothetical protein
MLDVHVECVNSSAPAATEPQMDLNTSQDPQPYNDECGGIHNYEHTNKGQVSGPSKRRRVFRFFKDVTVEVVSSIITEML